MRARRLLVATISGAAALGAAPPALATDPWWRPLQPVADSESAWGEQLVVTSLGEPVVTWARSAPDGATHLMASVARPDGTTGPPSDLGSARVFGTVARPWGGATAAWVGADGAVEVSDRAARGAFGPPREAAGPGTASPDSDLHVVSDGRGDQAIL